MFLTGQVDERAIQKYEKEAKEHHRDSWFLAYIFDLDEEERQRGITIQVGKAHFETQHKKYTIFDCPGHQGLVPAMISGATQADVALLVVSARTNEFERGFEGNGQTREHARLAKVLGATNIIVIVNKMDTCNWSESRFNEIANKMTPFLSKVCGFQKKRITFIPTCAIKGENILEKISEKTCNWYTGESLINHLDHMKKVKRRDDGPLRIPISEKSKSKSNIEFTGKIESGKIVKGQEILIVPENIKTTILEIESHSEPLESASCGDNVKIVVKDAPGIRIGSIITNENEEPPVLQEFIGKFEVLDTKPIFTAGYKPIMHIHSATVGVTITKILDRMNRITKTKTKNPSFAKCGDIVQAIIRTDEPISLEKYENMKQLGAFTLREDFTVAIGMVMKIKPLNSQ